MNTVLLEVSHLSIAGLPPVDFTLAAGEVVCLRGPSGCGKTRLLRALVDLDESHGRVRLSGEAREQVAPPLWRRRVALLPADSRWWAATVSEHFPHGLSNEPAALGFTENVAGWRVDRLSNGEKQRLALLRVLANQPRVLLLDEPTANLDPENTERVEALVTAYVEQAQAACLWVSHDEVQCARIAPRTLVMNERGVRVSA